MFSWFRQQVLSLMRVPHDPAPPFGAPGSTRIFRAGKNYFNLRLFGWGFAQLAALAAIIFWAVILIDVEGEARKQKAARGPLPALTADNLAADISGAFNENPPPTNPATPIAAPTNANADPTKNSVTAVPTAPTKPAGTSIKAKQKNRVPRIHINNLAGFKKLLVELALRLPDWAFPVIWALKLIGFALYLAQIPFTYALRRLDYELRWYIVTDRSLRIRTGLVRLQESTMSFANIQQVEVKQDPIQRLLKLADVHVQSAGGAGDNGHGKGEMHDSLHTGIFHSVDNANEIRDLILERLRQFRQTGLGDPDDHHDQILAGGVHPAREPSPAPADALAAAKEVLTEARALRIALAS